jgi:hypothetical protein
MSGGKEGRLGMTTRDDDRIDELDDEISLKPYFEILRSYRRVIGASVVGVGTLFVVGVILVFLVSPVERIGSIQFRLLFEGAEKGEYPNHTPFSPSELVAGPVLTEVYRINDLQRFGKYEDFKDSVFVQQANLELDLLSYEYQALLADTKLSPVDRARIQDEFKKKRAAMVDPSYSISMRRNERLKTLPRELMEKVLMDTLNTWAKQADERKGATRYNVAVLSANVLQKDVLEREDYLVAIDILRSKANRVLDTLTEIARLPGAEVIRVGPERVTLADVRTRLEEVVRFRLEPLLGLIRSEGVTKSSRGLALYAGNQLFQLRLEQQESADVVQALQTALRENLAQRAASSGDSKAGAAGPGGGAGGGQAMMPQLDQSFLDRIMALSTAQADAEYRRRLTDRLIEESVKMAARNREAAYYDDLVKELRTTTPRAAGSPEIVALIKTRSLEAFDEIAKGVERTAGIYQELSALNLNPSTALFSVSGPFSLLTQSALTLKTVLLYFVLLMMLTLIIAPVGCLVHHAVRKHV